MGIFVDPLVANDGTNDRTFNFRSQLPDKKSVVGEWVEPAAPLTDDSRIIIKHDTTSPVIRRRLMQHTQQVLLADGVTRKPVTVNLTLTYHSSHSEANITKCVKIAMAAMTKATFISNFLRGLI